MNLLQGDDATFAMSTGHWSDYSNTSLLWAPGSGVGGSGGLAVTATGSKMAVLSGTIGNGGLTAASPGSIYSGAISAEALSDSEEIQPALGFYTTNGTAITTVFGPGTRVAANQWAQSAPVVAIAPANTAFVALGLIVYNAAAGSKMVLDNAWIEQAAEATTPAVSGPLSTSGNRILQANGAPFIPRGVVLNGLETSPTASTVTQQAVVQAKAWGANIIRVPLGEQFWLSSNCDYSSGYQSEVNQVVNWITSLGMVALLDLHTNTVFGCQAGSPHNMADEAQSPTFWSQVAAQYASNPLVAFDLYNEPHNISDQAWLNGGMTVDSYFPYHVFQTAGMQQLYNTVRAAGAQNLVFLSGGNWANYPPSQPVSGTNIVYAAHAYTCQDAPPPSCSSPTPYDPSYILKPWISFSATYPVAITEFGWPSQNDGTYNSNVIAAAVTHGWGWIAFAWEDAQYPAIWDLTARQSGNSPFEPAPSGIPILCELVRASNGSSPCVAPAIAPSSTPAIQTAAPRAPAPSSLTPTAAPAATRGVPQAKVLTTSGANGQPVRTGSLRHACASTCDSNGSLVGAVYSPKVNFGKPGRSGTGSVVRVMRVGTVLAALGVFLVPAVARRLRGLVPQSA